MFDDVPAEVRAAFGVSGAARRLLGGGGTCLRIGDVVVKPDQPAQVASWQADVFDGLDAPGFRVPRPVRAVDGSWVHAGWAAWTWVTGEPAGAERWPELVAGCRAFHQALSDKEPPSWLGSGDSQWSVADRVAWGEAAIEVAPELADLVAALQAVIRPIDLPDQLVHGDIAGNMLFADGVAPAVIDFSPYWRPSGYPLAIAAVDLLTWSGAPASILGLLDGVPEIDQLLLRALMFRTVTESIARTDAGSRTAVREVTEPVVELVLARVAPLRLSDEDIARHVSQALGREVTAVRSVHSGLARCSFVETVDVPVFVKVGHLGVEAAVHEALEAQPFLPRVLAAVPDPAMLVMEVLPEHSWARGWTPPLVERTRSLLHDVHELPAPAGVPRLGAEPNPWDVIAADPQRLLRLDVCTADWLDAHLGTLRAAAADAKVTGDRLLHLDVQAANLWYDGDRLVLTDWASAAAGDPCFGHHLWLVALHAEHGPPPDTSQGPGAAAHAALIAGQQSLRDSDPALFEQRRRRTGVALSWAARQLGLPRPRDGVVYLETERLVLRRFDEHDVADIVELDGDPEVMRYLTGGEPTPADAVRDDFLPAWLAYYDRGERYGFWAAIEKTTGEFLGWFHFRPHPDGTGDGVELGYRLRRCAWGRGYATEGSKALIDKGFTEFGVERVWAGTMAVNTGSRRVMEKAGLRYVRAYRENWPQPIPGNEEGEVEYALTREEWASR